MAIILCMDGWMDGCLYICKLTCVLGNGFGAARAGPGPVPKVASLSVLSAVSAATLRPCGHVNARAGNGSSNNSPSGSCMAGRWWMQHISHI